MADELILIVEDNERNLKLVRDILNVHGFRTVEARSGEEAIELARAKSPALILMDVQLPGMDGVGALRELRGVPETSATPVVAVTAFAMHADRDRVLSADFDGYLTKPIDTRELPSYVRTQLARDRTGAKA